MNRIDKKFRELAGQKKKAFIAYITAGDPSLAVTQDLAVALQRAGVDIIELGIPFSDPLADGPTIQAASHRALKAKVTMDKVFKMVGALRTKTSIPIAFMSYYNPVFKYGVERFIMACRTFGVDGVIIPDLPYEEAAALGGLAKKYKISNINLIAPTSTIARIRHIIKASTGFIYYVSLTGVTGARRDLPLEIVARVRAVKRLTKKPVCVGFGISTAAQAAKLSRIADGVIVGSAIVKLVGEGGDIVRHVSKYVKKIAKAIHGV